jgi:hypothetical protein
VRSTKRSNTYEIYSILINSLDFTYKLEYNRRIHGGVTAYSPYTELEIKDNFDMDEKKYTRKQVDAIIITANFMYIIVFICGVIIGALLG